MLQALAFHAQGETTAALGSIERTLTLAEREGYHQLFIDEGPPMARLLEKVVAYGLSTYAGKLLTAFGTQQPGTITPTTLVDALSEREMAVLRLLKTEMSGPEIADALGIALSTIRTHTKNIYSKLHATNRRAAVNRAEALGLV